MSNTSTNIRFCLIVATLGRTDELNRLLSSLSRQTYKLFRVVIVDQNTDDRLSHLIEIYSPIFSIRWIRLSSKGVSLARNAGIALVADSDDIISFPDDDCQYPDDALMHVVQCYSKTRFNTLAGINVSLESHGVCRNVRLGALNRYGVFKNGPTYVFFYERAIVMAIGGFDESLGPSDLSPFLSSEDTDFSIRALNYGSKNFRDKGLRISHPSLNISTDRDYHKCLGYAIGRSHLLQKHGFPLWFKCVNLLYPLAGFLFNIFDRKLRKYYAIQFCGRLGV